MTIYSITNTAGTVVATLNPTTTTGSSFPVELVGQGLSLYGPIIAQNQYRHLENFAKSTPPTNPIAGMLWYDTVNLIPNYYDGTRFIPLLSATSASNSRFAMLTAAQTVSLTSATTTAIFQAPGTGAQYYPTGVLLIPVSVNAVTTPAVFNLYTGTSEDILENVMVVNPTTNKHAFFAIEGMTRTVSGSQSIYLEVTSAATGGTGLALTYNVIVFGHVAF